MRALVGRAEAGGLALTSLMARLTVRTGSERLLIPAFVFFFQMLFPFAWVNNPARKTAAAAGGCMLVRRQAVEAAGGLAAIRGEIIDDCALGRLMKHQGPIWLGLTKRAQSLRPYAGLGEIAAMVARSAYAQLGHSPLMLAGTVVGMAIVYAGRAALDAVWTRTGEMAGPGGLDHHGPGLPADPAALSPVGSVGRGPAVGGHALWRLHALVGCSHVARPRWAMERQAAGSAGVSELSSGKGHKDENFPVASVLIARRHRPAVMAFYRVARMADDIADHPTAPPEEKLARLAAIERTLTGQDEAVTTAAELRAVMTAKAISPQHMLDLLEAFRRDVVKTRYADWAELMDYCRYSAAPVGRYVLEVHGEGPATWPASDALCAALQVINHLQDCGDDYCELDRVYVPLDALAAGEANVAALCAERASPALRIVIASLAGRVLDLLKTARPLAAQVRDTRLRLEVGVIDALAASLAGRLARRDPLSEKVHHRPHEALGVALMGASRALGARVGARQSHKAAP